MLLLLSNPDLGKICERCQRSIHFNHGEVCELDQRRGASAPTTMLVGTCLFQENKNSGFMVNVEKVIATHAIDCMRPDFVVDDAVHM